MSKSQCCSWGRLFCLAWLAAVGTSAWADDPEVPASPVGREAKIVGGQVFRGELASLDASGVVRFQTADGDRSLPLNELVRWGTPVPSGSRNRHEVFWGTSRLSAELLGYSLEETQVSHELWGRGNWRSASLRGVILQPPRLPEDVDRLRQRVLTADEGADWLLLANGDTVRCEVSVIDRQEIRVLVDRQPLTLARHLVVAVGFDPQTRTVVGNHDRLATVGWQDGSLLEVASIRLDSQECQATLVGGGHLTTRNTEAARRQLNYLRPLGQRVVYLSDLPPHDYRHIALLSIDWPLEKDRNVLGGALRASGQWYDKGLGMHSASRVVFDSGGQFTELAAAVAVDDAAEQGGSVVFRVYTEDADQKWRLAWESPVVRGAMRPVEMRVDVRAIQRIALVVDQADGVDQRDYADWLEPRLIRAP